ncbi:MAG TPA: MBL fold metallo-hydrolase [Gammaproteobacteria bacterium]
MIKNRLAWGAALCTLAPAALAQQQDLSAVQIQTEQVADGLYMLVGAGGNIALSVGDDGALIVDTQFAPLTEKIQAAIRAAGGGDVAFVINTHWHGDHTGGNENFGKAGATIVGHANVRVRMSTEQFNATFNSTTPPSPAVALPVVVYPERTTLHWNGHTINIFHVPNAHTDGDSIVHFTDLNVFHMGDTFVNGGYPFVDVSSAGSVDGIIAAAEAVLARSDAGTRIIPGHGPLADREDLERFLEVVKAARDRIQSLIDQGRSVDEVVAAKPTAEWDAEWGAGFMNGETFTRLVYQSLSR